MVMHVALGSLDHAALRTLKGTRRSTKITAGAFHGLFFFFLSWLVPLSGHPSDFQFFLGAQGVSRRRKTRGQVEDEGPNGVRASVDECPMEVLDVPETG